MNLDIWTQLAGIIALNLIALVLLLAVEIYTRRRRSAVPGPAAEAPVDLENWIEEVEEAEHRQAFASGGDFLPHQRRAANG